MTRFLSLFLVLAPTAYAQETYLPDTQECTFENPDEQDPVILQSDLQQLLGTIPVLQADFGQLFTGYWTNWSADPMQTGLAKLAVMRGALEYYNLYDVYLPGQLVGNEDGTTVCGPETAFTRTLDGTCNDPVDPQMGAAGTRFGRNVPPPLAWPNEATLMDPNPREVSRKLLQRKDFEEVPFLNMLAASWIQFQIHDWFSHGDNSTTDILHVPLKSDDPLHQKYGINYLAIPATAPDATRTAAEQGVLPPTFTNEVTHWWDGSQLYGSDQATSDRLRTFEGGHLRIDEDGLLPESYDGAEDAGFRRNWWVGLSLMHTLFAKEHNAIADMLAEEYPEMSDEELFHKARMINAALMAKIHTLEWTPAILPNKTLEVGMNANWHGLNEYLYPQFPFQVGNAVIDGVVGGQRDLHGVPYSLTEEFVSVYRMHPLLPEKITVRDASSGHVVEVVATADTRDDDALALAREHGIGDLMYSFGVSHPGALVPQNFPKFMSDLRVPGGFVLDMGTVDVLRDRERGIPRYNNARRALLLPPVSDFSDLTDDKQLEAKLRQVYDNDIEKLDLLVGTYAESTRPTCYGFGETLFQVFTLMATRRLQGDRFYTELYTPEVYTPEGIEWVESQTMVDVLLRHYPELAETGLAETDNAFYPWE
ncbi:MAG: peroxidase [Deltaproteobacteria bacterium]|nr:MAG: peroxidase [Deltaproteobacteria bacterium]